MDRSSPLRRLVLILLTSTYIVGLHGLSLTGGAHSLHCVNNYLSIINCTLNITSSHSNSSYWLTFTQNEQTFVCMLVNTNETYFCSATPTDRTDDEWGEEKFMDTDVFEISLCHEQNDSSDSCQQLDDEYMPVKNVKPNAPCCLIVSHNSSQHRFNWKSTYESSNFSSLNENLQYELHYYDRRDKDDVRVLNTDGRSFTVEGGTFVPGTDYAARVRSSPKGGIFEGQWSDWSPEVHWTTQVLCSPQCIIMKPSLHVNLRTKVLIPLCVTATLVLLLCYASVEKWRQRAFIPNPAPYFQSLYSECHGDFKSWVDTPESPGDARKVEETTRIDTLTKCAGVQEEGRPAASQRPLPVGAGGTHGYVNNPTCDASTPGVPYAVSTMAPPPGAGDPLTPGGPAGGDSGCWLSSDSPLVRNPPCNSNEYCTLSALQQHRAAPAKSCKAGARV